MCESVGHCNCLCESISLQSLCWFFNYFVWIIIIVCVVWYAKSSINFWPMLKPYFLVVLDFLLFCLNLIIVVCVVWYDKWKEDKKNVWRIFGHFNMVRLCCRRATRFYFCFFRQHKILFQNGYFNMTPGADPRTSQSGQLPSLNLDVHVFQHLHLPLQVLQHLHLLLHVCRDVTYTWDLAARYSNMHLLFASFQFHKVENFKNPTQKITFWV